MIKVAFWSSAPKNGVTVNLAVLSAMAALEYPMSITVFENHLDREGLGQMLLGGPWDAVVREPMNYYCAGGQDEMFIQSLSARFGRKFIDSEMVEIIEDKLMYLYQNFMVSPELFEYEFCRNVLPKLRGRHSSMRDICFIDTASKNNISTMQILDDADIVVVNLVQNKLIMDNFFENYKSLLNKSVFLISNYRKKSQITRRTFAEHYGVETSKVAIIPHSEGLFSAAYDGDVPGYMSSISPSKSGDEFFFANETKKALYMLVDNILAFYAKDRNNERRITVGEFKSGKIVPFGGRHRW